MSCWGRAAHEQGHAGVVMLRSVPHPGDGSRREDHVGLGHGRGQHPFCLQRACHNHCLCLSCKGSSWHNTHKVTGGSWC